MSFNPRHRQTAISFRSDKAAELLAQLTRHGRSQALVIEDALARMIAEAPPLSVAEFECLIDAAVEPARGYAGPSRIEIEAEMYDESGALR